MANNHEIGGICDLCGIEAESEVAEITGLSCSSKHEVQIFHQACVDKYLKSIRCERNRKSGFPCPRGCGKAAIFPEKCKGKITKSHPVTIRSEGNKKRRQAELESLQKATPEHCTKGKSSKESPPPAASSKSEKKSTATAAASTVGGKNGKPVPTKPVIIRALNVANPRLTSLPPPKTAAELQKEALQAARDKLRAEIAINNKQSSSLPTATSRLSKPAAASSSSSASTTKQVMTLDEYMAVRSASNASTAGGFSSVNKLNETRSSSAASSVPSAVAVAAATAAAAAVSSRPVMANNNNNNNAWSRMTSLGDHPNSANTFPSATQSIESFPLTPGREMLSSSYAPSEEYSALATAATAAAGTGASTVPIMVFNRGIVTPPPGAPGTETDTAGTTPRAAAAASASELSSSLKEIIPGMIDHSKLTKAQRKNLKRAEKKAAARLEETSSLVSCVTDSHKSQLSGCGEVCGDHGGHFDHTQDELYHQFDNTILQGEDEDHDASHQHVFNTNTNNYLGDTPPLQSTSPVNGSSSSGGGGGDGADGQNGDADDANRYDSSISKESLECLVAYKLNNTISELCRLGFSYEASSCTAIACGGDLHSSIQDLLVAESGAESLYTSGDESPVDISEELAAVQLLKQRYRNVLPVLAWDNLIVQCMGNLNEVARHLEIQENMAKMQYQQQQQQEQQQLQQMQQQSSLGNGNVIGAGGGLGGGNLFGDNTFGLPDEILWGQSASQHPACASNEWNSLLNGSGGGGDGGLFDSRDSGTTTAAAGSGLSGLGLGSSLFGTITNDDTIDTGMSRLGLGLDSLGFSSPSPAPAPQYQNLPQQQQYQQTAPQLMPGISHQQHQQRSLSQGLGSSNFSGTTVLSGGGGCGGGGDLWGSVSTVGAGSFGAGNGTGVGYYGTSHVATGMASALSYDANNNANTNGGYLNQGSHLSHGTSPLNTPTSAGSGYGMSKMAMHTGGMQYPYSHQQQNQQMQYSPGAVGNGGGSLWGQPQQQQQDQARTSFEGNNMHTVQTNSGFYANGTGNATGGSNGLNGGIGNATYPGSMMMAMVQDQAHQEQRELQSLMGNLGLYSS